MKRSKKKPSKQPLKTTHGLIFEVTPWWVSQEFKRFKVGTCEGLFGVTKRTYDILAITNEQPGNGHLNDVFEIFEHSCKREGKDLRILEVWNEKFGAHLVAKRGFERQEAHCIKKFT